jgi:hypothetical protein
VCGSQSLGAKQNQFCTYRIVLGPHPLITSSLEIMPLFASVANALGLVALLASFLALLLLKYASAGTKYYFFSLLTLPSCLHSCYPTYDDLKSSEIMLLVCSM